MEEQNQTENIIIKKNRGRPATKHGNYDNKQYYATFKEKNQIKIHEVLIVVMKNDEIEKENNL